MILKKYQGGHAALLFAMIIPVLFGVFTLATDGARAVQDKARLEEAVEVATLAVAGQNSDDSGTQKALATKYIEYYFPQAEVDNGNLDVSKTSGVTYNKYGGEQRYFQYSVRASIKQNSWFPGNENIVGLGSSYDVGGSSVVRKYQSKTVDVIFVADYSGSMRNDWSYEDEDGSRVTNVKYEDLVNIIADVTDQLQEYNDELSDDSLKNRAAFTAYNTNVYRSEISRQRVRVCTGTIWGYCYSYDYRYIDVTSFCRIDYLEYYGGWNRSVSYSQTVDNMFDDKSCTGSYSNLFSKVDATINFDSFNDRIDGFYPQDGTASYQGLMDGANIAYNIDDPNPRQLIVILSDGNDNDKTITQGLADAGMCNDIVDTLQSRTSTNNEGTTEQIKARIAMIGFGYDTSTNTGLTSCVGSDNVFEADSSDDIKYKILELITEEIGHLAPSDED